MENVTLRGNQSSLDSGMGGWLAQDKQTVGIISLHGQSYDVKRIFRSYRTQTKGAPAQPVRLEKLYPFGDNYSERRV